MGSTPCHGADIEFSMGNCIMLSDTNIFREMTNKMHNIMKVWEVHHLMGLI